MLTLVLILIPLVAALLIFALDAKTGRVVAMVSALAELVMALFVVSSFEKNSEWQFTFSQDWVSSIGLSFSVGIDGISLVLILLTALLTPFIVVSAFNNEKPASFYGLILLMESALVGVFTAQDALLFYLFWEMALIPVYFICLMWGGENRSAITFKFFVYTLAGSLVMLAALIYLYQQTPGNTFSLDAIYEAGRALPAAEQMWIFWALFVAFAIKMPVFPFHTWQPDTYTSAPVQGTMLLSGIMLKMGLYGVIRWLLPVIPEGVQQCGPIAVILSVIGIVYASCIAIVQKDYKRLIAYSSMAHVGLISAGIFTLKNSGVQGAMIQMLSHGILAFGMFYCVDIINTRTNTRTLSELGGIRNIAPVFATIFIILTLGSVSLPLTSGFAGEFLLLNSLFQYQWVLGLCGGLTIIFGAVYMLRSYQQSVLGETNKLTASFVDLTFSERAVIFPIAALVLLIGIFPGPVLEISQASVEKILAVYSNGVAVK